MTAAQFVEARRGDWVALERLLSGRRARLGASEASRISALFRAVCADLARARSAGYPEDLLDYLNSLAARSHNAFYRAPPPDRARLLRFFRHSFPAAARRNARYLVAALLLFYGSLGGAVALAFVDDQALFKLVPRVTLEQAEAMYREGHAGGRGEQTDALMTGFYVRNNVGIAFQCFAAGVFFGLGSVVVLLLNGVMIGAVIGFISQTPSALNLLSFIAAHGPFELTAICIAGAAGLRLGFGLVSSGELRRVDSLRLAAREAVVLVLGAAVLLLLAALIEGFVSPSSLPPAVKFSVSGLCAALLLAYLGFYQDPTPAAASAEVGR